MGRLGQTEDEHDSGDTRIYEENSDSTGDWVWNLCPFRGWENELISDVAIEWIEGTKVLRRSF